MAFDQITDDIEQADARHGGKVGFTAGADIIAGQAVTLSGNNEVSPSDTDGEEVIGIATQSVSNGDTVDVNGISTVSNARVSTAVDAGDPLTSNGATGEEGELAEADTDGDHVVGYALEGIGAGDYGQIVIVHSYFDGGA